MSKIDQKEYLKKYLSGEKTKKKNKKKKENNENKSRIKIIDDDIDIIKNDNVDDDLILTGEDAPQIVGIIDDRPPELKTIEDFRGSEKWKTLSNNIKDHKSEKNIQGSFRRENKNNGTKALNSPIRKEKYDFSKSIKYEKKNTARSDDDFSPIRKNRRSSDDDLSPARKYEVYRKQSSRDFSPPRRQSEKSKEDYLSPQRKHKAESLRRRKSRDSNSDYSPPRKLKNLENFKTRSRTGSFPYSNNIRNPRTNSKGDSLNYSPHRKSRQYENSRSRYRGNNYIASPYRKQQERYEKFQKSEREPRDGSSDYSPRRKQIGISVRKDSRESSSSRRYTSGTTNERDNSPILEEKRKSQRTLDGKKAGLQDAKSLKKETEQFRRKENEMFKNMSENISGKNAEICVRNIRRKTSTEIQKEEEREREKNKREQEKQETYSRWGKGLKQIEDYQNKIADEKHEINKPLARYSNDADLDEMLKKQEREGDPMLNYIREKNKDLKKNSKIPVVPTYKGTFPENRFNIRPGYRWDGVDRSNGYEKKWFDVQNQKKAIQEEAYKYSIEDM